MTVQDICDLAGELIWQTNSALDLVECRGGRDFPEPLRTGLVSAPRLSDWAGPYDATRLETFMAAQRDFETALTDRGPLRLRAKALLSPSGRFRGYAGTLAYGLPASVNGDAEVARLRREHRLMREALNASPVNITIVDTNTPDHPLTFVNDAFCETSGYARHEVVGRNCRFLQGPETDPKALDRMRRAITAGQALDIEVLNYRKDGEPFWNSLSLAPVRDTDGRTCAFIGVQRDVTHDRQAQMAELTRQRLESLGELAGGIAHEINNLLQPALMYCDMIADDLPDGCEDAHAQLASINESARTIRAIVKDILAFSRDDGTGDAEVTDFNGLVGDVVEFTRGLLPSSVSLSINGPTVQAPCPVTLRRTDFQKIVLNLAVNAAHAMDNKGCIRVSWWRDGDRIFMDFADEGGGIPEEARARIFEPFFSTKPIGSGTGLGLSIVHSIVTALGGHIDIRETGPAGTVFRLSFWCAGEGVAEGEAA